jgi:SulP family sulfate permease
MLDKITKRSKKHDIEVIFSHVNEQPMHAMEKAGFISRVGRDNFCDHIDTALLRAEKLEDVARKNKKNN